MSSARASILSGVYPHQHGVTANSGVYRQELPNLARSLLGEGYRLGYSGKWHVDDTYGPPHFGFHANDWLGYSHPAGGVYLRSFARSCRYPVNHYLEYLAERGLAVPELEEAVYFPANANFEIYARQTGPVEASVEHYVAEEAIAQVRQFARRGRSDGQPFFIWTNFWGPHDPFVLPEPFFSMYTAEDVQLSPSMAEGWCNKPWVQKMMSTHYWGVEDMDEAIWREAVAKYAGYCAFLDWETGRTIQVSPYEHLLQEAKEQQKAEGFRERYDRARSTVERVIAHLARHGFRQGRYFGRAKTLFQALWSAAAVNLQRLVALLSAQGASQTAAEAA